MAQTEKKMSHFTELKVDFKVENEKDLIAAMKAMFGDEAVEVHDTPVALRLYTGEDASKVRRQGYEAEKCHIIVRKETLGRVHEHQAYRERGSGFLPWNDMGLVRDEDGKYRVFVDTAGFSQKQMGLLSQDYSARVSERKLRSQGYTIQRQKLDNGTVRLTATKY